MPLRHEIDWPLRARTMSPPRKKWGRGRLSQSFVWLLGGLLGWQSEAYAAEPKPVARLDLLCPAVQHLLQEGAAVEKPKQIPGTELGLSSFIATLRAEKPAIKNKTDYTQAQLADLSQSVQQLGADCVLAQKGELTKLSLNRLLHDDIKVKQQNQIVFLSSVLQASMSRQFDELAKEAKRRTMPNLQPLARTRRPFVVPESRWGARQTQEEEFGDTLLSMAALELLKKEQDKVLCGPFKTYLENWCSAFKSDPLSSLLGGARYLKAAAQNDIDHLPLQAFNKSAKLDIPQALIKLGLIFFDRVLSGRTPEDTVQDLSDERLNELLASVPDDAKKEKATLLHSLKMARELFRIAASVKSSDVESETDFYRDVVVFSLITDTLGQELKEDDYPSVHRWVRRSLRKMESFHNNSSGPLWSRKAPPRDQIKHAEDVLKTFIEVARCSEPNDLGWSEIFRVIPFGESLLQRDATDEIAKATALLLDRPGDVTLPSEVFGALTLLGSVASARDSREIAGAINAKSSPSNSYQAKRERVTVSVDALLGVTSGFEWLKERRKGFGEMPFLGPSLPLGVHLTHNGKSSVNGLFMSVLDAGAPATFRLFRQDNREGEEAQISPNPSLGSLLSPGLFATWNPTVTPFTLALGFSFVPDLRTISRGGARSKSGVTRVHAFIAYDIPLF